MRRAVGRDRALSMALTSITLCFCMLAAKAEDCSAM